MLGGEIKRLMKEKKMKAKELAEKSGITPSYLSQIINNKRLNPSLVTLADIADALEVPISQIVPDGYEGTLIDLKTGETIYSNRPQISSDNKEIPEEFTDPKEAREYIKKHYRIFASEGIEIDKLDDEKILNFANELLEQMKLVAYKYKK